MKLAIDAAKAEIDALVTKTRQELQADPNIGANGMLNIFPEIQKEVKTGKDSFDGLVNTCIKPLRDKWISLSNDLKTQLGAIDDLLNPEIASLNGGSATISSLMGALITKIKNRTKDLAKAACDGDIKNDLAVPGLLTKNPLKTYAQPVVRKKLLTITAFSKELILSLNSKLMKMFAPYNSNNPVTSEFPITSSALFPLNAEIKKIYEEIKNKKLTELKTSLFSGLKNQTKATAKILAGETPFKNSISKMRSDIANQVNEYYNMIIDKMNEYFKKVEALLNQSSLSNAKNSIAAVFSSNSAGSVSLDAFKSASKEALDNFNKRITHAKSMVLSAISETARVAKETTLANAKAQKEKADAAKKTAEQNRIAEEARRKKAEEDAEVEEFMRGKKTLSYPQNTYPDEAYPDDSSLNEGASDDGAFEEDGMNQGDASYYDERVEEGYPAQDNFGLDTIEAIF